MRGCRQTAQQNVTLIFCVCESLHVCIVGHGVLLAMAVFVQRWLCILPLIALRADCDIVVPSPGSDVSPRKHQSWCLGDPGAGSAVVVVAPTPHHAIAASQRLHCVWSLMWICVCVCVCVFVCVYVCVCLFVCRLSLSLLSLSPLCSSVRELSVSPINS